MSQCLWCKAPLERPDLLQHSPEHLAYLRRFAAVVYPRFGALGSEVDAAAVATGLCDECYGHVVGLGARVEG